MAKTTPTRPPGHAPDPPASRAAGPKYLLAKKALRVEPYEWIARRRAADYRGGRPIGEAGPLPFRVIADELNAKLVAADIPIAVTWETVRSWYRTPPTGTKAA
jgi:hypothetical protein